MTEVIKFSDLGLSEPLLKAIEDIGFEEPTAIQRSTIPLVMSGRDVIGQSQTGTGKTAAFTIPAIERIDPSKRRDTQVLIMCPTRELAVQACDEIRKFTKYIEGIKTLAVYGGQPIDRQIKALRFGAQIVVGTPGRIMDHMRRGTLKLGNVSIVILDEADEMLSMGFREDMETIISEIDHERQTVLFSATMSKEILEISERFLQDPEVVRVVPEQLTVAEIKQYYYEVPHSHKIEALGRLLDMYNPNLSMVFCNTKRQVDELVSELQLRGYLAEGLHGDLKQQARDHVMNQFRLGNVDVLVATDVAARGIDINDIAAVFNYDIPQDIEYYVHRIGRTGRAGKKGRAFTFVTGRREMYELRQIMNYTHSKVELRSIPMSGEVLERRMSRYGDKIRAAVEDGGLEQYIAMVESLCDEEVTPIEVAAALLKTDLTSDGKTGMPSEEDDRLFNMQKGMSVRPRVQDGYSSGGRGGRNGGGSGRDRQRGSFSGGRDGYSSGRERRGDRGESGRSFRRDDRDMVRLVINIGRESRVAPNHILGAVAGETGLAGKTFGRIEIGEKMSVIEVPKELKTQVLNSMKDVKIMGRKTTISEERRR
ncbi:MAG: DEAD/DEAH box helicase [Oscillospiraceae bacterium]|nr:DEAD/DEAH box helicase [Oscillospiraceae bacterium]